MSEVEVSISASGCSRVLRKSFSDPTDLLRTGSSHVSAIKELDRCFSLLSVIGRSIKNTENLVRKMPGTCKWCHAPTGALHTGSKWGYNICRLQHSALCDGGITAILEKRMACPLGYQKGMVMVYEEDPRVDSSGSESDVSYQHSSQLESETAIDDDDDLKEVEKNETSLIDLIAGDLNTMGLGKKNDMPVNPKLVSVSLSSDTISSWSTAGSTMSSGQIPGFSHGLFTSASSNPLLFPNPNLILQQQVEEMKRQQLLQLARDKERDEQLAAMKKQLDESQKVEREKRNENSVRPKENRNVSFSASSGGELNDHASKLAARAQRKAKHKENNVGVDMNKIRKTPGMGSRVDDFMQNVNDIPSLSLGNKPAEKAKSKRSKETQSETDRMLLILLRIKLLILVMEQARLSVQITLH